MSPGGVVTNRHQPRRGGRVYNKSYYVVVHVLCVYCLCIVCMVVRHVVGNFGVTLASDFV